jgi:multicomponent Na+:H+ antiporter subunit D
LQIVFFAVLAFSLLIRYKFYPPELRSTNLNIDWIYRRALPWAIGKLVCFFKPLDQGFRHVFLTAVNDFVGVVRVYMGPEGLWARTWPTGSTVLWVAVLLGSYLFLSLL